MFSPFGNTTYPQMWIFPELEDLQIFWKRIHVFQKNGSVYASSSRILPPWKIITYRDINFQGLLWIEIKIDIRNNIANPFTLVGIINLSHLKSVNQRYDTSKFCRNCHGYGCRSTTETRRKLIVRAEKNTQENYYYNMSWGAIEREFKSMSLNLLGLGVTSWLSAYTYWIEILK